jgi:Ca2+/Na+ antiporter
VFHLFYFNSVETKPLNFAYIASRLVRFLVIAFVLISFICNSSVSRVHVIIVRMYLAVFYVVIALFFIVEVRSESKKTAANENNEEETRSEKFNSTAKGYSEQASMISSIIKTS